MSIDLEKGLSNLSNGPVTVREIETPEDPGGANISVHFQDGSVLNACYWRILGDNGTSLSSFDHNQKYGLPESVNAKGALASCLNGQIVTEAKIDRKSGDLVFRFSGGWNLQVFRFTGYEVWDIHFPNGTGEYSNHV